MPIFGASSIQLFAPGWSKGYYSSNNARPEIKIEDGTIVVTHHLSKEIDFNGNETFRMAASIVWRSHSMANWPAMRR